MPIKPMLGDLELHQVQRLETEGDQLLVAHRVPGLEGDFLQGLGRRGGRIALTGVAAGAASREDLKALRGKFLAAEPLAFVSDIATATQVDQVVIEEMEVRELAGKPTRYEYAFALREYTPAPVEETEQPSVDPLTPPDDDIDGDLGTLVVDVTVEGDPGFDFGRLRVTVDGTAEDGSSFSRTLSNRNGNVWTEEDLPAGSYTVRVALGEEG